MLQQMQFQGLSTQYEQQKPSNRFIQSPDPDNRIEPWFGKPTNKMSKVQAHINNRQSNIFSLSCRNPTPTMRRSFNKTQMFSKTMNKPATATLKQRGKSKNISYLSQELASMRPLTTSQVLDEEFQQKLSSISYYPQFKASAQQKRNLFYLKPYVKKILHNNQKSLERVQKLKTELYKGIFDSQKVYDQLLDPEQSVIPSKINTNRSVIQYMTEYKGEDISQNNKIDQLFEKQKKIPISVLKQKLKNKYKRSNYASQIGKIRKGQAGVITIIQ